MKTILFIVGILFAFYGCNTKNEKKDPAKETKNENYTFTNVKPGTYSGEGEGVVWFSITFLAENDTIKASKIGYKFSGSLEVGRSFLKSGGFFGNIEKGKFSFQFPVFVKFAPSTSLVSERGSTQLSHYSVEITNTETPDVLNCKLNKIYILDNEYNNFTMEDINLASPNVEMLNEYNFTIKLVNEEVSNNN
jgi:hypothetical protein